MVEKFPLEKANEAFGMFPTTGLFPCESGLTIQCALRCYVEGNGPLPISNHL